MGLGVVLEYGVDIPELFLKGEVEGCEAILVKVKTSEFDA